MQNNTSDLNSITSTNTRNVDTDVEIVSDLADLEDGIEIPESYHHEKRPRKLKYKKKINKLCEICTNGLCAGR